MKTTTLKIIACLLFYSCSRMSEETQTATTNPSVNPPPAALEIADEMCFRQVEGNQKQDTAWVHLRIKQDKVTGEFWHLPFEKDSRRGTLSGTKKGDEILATWTFSQEGQTDSLPVQFQLNQNTLRQKPYSYHVRTGREYLPDTAPFTIIFNKIDCTNFPAHTNAVNY